MARGLILVGVLLVLAGVLWTLFPRALGWFGHLPGDIRVQREGFSLFIPLTSMLILSVTLTLSVNGLAWLVRKLNG